MTVATFTSTLVRPYRPDDRDQLRAIVCATAFRNRGHTVMVDDAGLFADYWSRYYTDHEPESCLVAERNGEVVGYLLGCIDPRRFRRVMGREIVPGAMARLAARAVREGIRGRWHEARVLQWLVWRAWREAPAIDAERYPAHYHLNVHRSAVGERLYTEMALRFMQYAQALGVPGAHGQVLDRRDGGVWQRLVGDFRVHHPSVVVYESTRASSMGRVLLNDRRPLVNRVFGGSTADFITFLQWIREWRRL